MGNLYNLGIRCACSGSRYGAGSRARGGTLGHPALRIVIEVVTNTSLHGKVLWAWLIPPTIS